MAYVVADRVLETSTTTGTGAFALAAAITGFRRFSAVCATSDTCPYYIEVVDIDGNPTGEWETGIGTYSSADTLTRTSVVASSNANAAVNFSAGTKRVGIVASRWVDSSKFSAFGFSLVDDADAAAARTTLGLGSAATQASSAFVAASSGTATDATLVNPILTGTPTEDVFTITDGSSVTINPADGSTQLWTLGANRTPTLSSITAGKSVRLGVDDGTAYSLTLTSVTWRNNGGSAPTLKTTGYTWILIENVGGTLYADLLGDGG
jgi:hypothetical protein